MKNPLDTTINSHSQPEATGTGTHGVTTPFAYDKNGNTIFAGDAVVITGHISRIPENILEGNFSIVVDIDGLEGEKTNFYLSPAAVTKGLPRNTLNQDSLARTMREAGQLIRQLYADLDKETVVGRARETALRETIIQLAAGRSGIMSADTCSGTPIDSYSYRIATRLESMAEALSGPAPAPAPVTVGTPVPEYDQPSEQASADMQFQAGRNIARAGNALPDLASSSAREGYEYERAVIAAKDAGIHVGSDSAGVNEIPPPKVAEYVGSAQSRADAGDQEDEPL